MIAFQWCSLWLVAPCIFVVCGNGCGGGGADVCGADGAAWVSAVVVCGLGGRI